MDALVHLIPKSSGGTRPIGLVQGLCRLWEAARRPLMVAWRTGMRRTWDNGAKGNTMSMALWLQSLWDEWAQGQDQQSAATTLIDLQKAFESVLLSRLWANGVMLGVPLQLLRLSLEMQGFLRHLVFSTVADPRGIETHTAILAGTAFAGVSSSGS